MSSPPLDEEEYRRWREEAQRALDSARRESAAGAHNWSCFLAEQSAQLAVKALLHGLGRGPWGHDLMRLGREGHPVGFEPAEYRRALAKRNRLACEVTGAGVILAGGDFFAQSAAASRMAAR